MRYLVFDIPVSCEDLIHTLSLETHNDLIDLIKALDEKVAAVDFTEALRDYFVEEMMEEEIDGG